MNWIRILRIVATVLLVIAILKLPIGYYQFLRIAITLIALVNAYVEYHEGSKLWLAMFVALAILFNPIFPIYLNKDTWIPIDIISAAIFGISVFLKRSFKKFK